MVSIHNLFGEVVLILKDGHGSIPFDVCINLQNKVNQADTLKTILPRSQVVTEKMIERTEQTQPHYGAANFNDYQKLIEKTLSYSYSVQSCTVTNGFQHIIR